MTVVYCLGDIKAKREAFAFEGEKEENLYLDNCEVLGAIKADGQTVFGIGENPYGNMTAEEFIRYESGKRKGETLRLMKIFGVKVALNKKIKKLKAVPLRIVWLIARYGASVKTLYINFDSLLPTSKNKRQVKDAVRLLSRYFDVVVSVSDSRFIPEGSKIRRYESEKKFCEIALNKYRIEKGKKKDFLAVGGETGDLSLKKVTLTRY